MTTSYTKAFIIGFIIVSAASAACREGSAENASAATAAPAGTPPAAPAEVRVVKAEEREVPTIIRATGTFAADESSDLTPAVPGTVIATPVDVGAFVQSGQLLVRLDPRDASLRLQQMQASLQQAEAEAQRARVEADRNAKLAQSGDISKSSYNRMTAQVAVAEAAVAQVRVQVATAQKALEDTTVHAPFAGHISARPVALGEYITTATKLVTLVRIQPIKLNLQVPEADAAGLRPGMVVQAQVTAYQNAVFAGKVSALNVAIDPTSRAMTVEATFPNRDSRLTPGMFGSAEVRLSGTARALFVPKAAVVATPDGEASAIYVIEDGKARLRVVHASEEEGGAVRILSGLDAGVSVIAAGVDHLFDGAPVRVAQ